MLCFKDMTFCDAPCGNVMCHRRLTDKVRHAAKEWWGENKGEPPMSVSDYTSVCADFKPEILR